VVIAIIASWQFMLPALSKSQRTRAYGIQCMNKPAKLVWLLMYADDFNEMFVAMIHSSGHIELVIRNMRSVATARMLTTRMS